MKNKILSILLALILILTFASCDDKTESTKENAGGNSVQSEKAPEEKKEEEVKPLYETVNKSDYPFADLEWTFADGVLTFSGEGRMPNGLSSEHAWNIHAKETTSVVIGEGIVSVGESNFYDFYNIESITFPSTLLFIEDCGFYGCSSLTSLTLPEGLIEIGQSAFDACFDLSEINFPSTLVKIGKNAFSAIGDIEELNFPNSLKSIGESAFYGSVVKTVTIPESVVEIEAAAFGSSWVLETLNLYASDTDIPNFFHSSPKLKTVNVGNSYVVENNILYNKDKTVLIACLDTSMTTVEIPDSVTKIANSAFIKCENLTSVVIHKNIKEIEESAFMSCPKLSEVIIENGLETVNDFAFAFCDSLSAISFPESTSYVGYGTFRGCDSIADITFGASESKVEFNTSDLERENKLEVLNIVYGK